MNTIWDVCKLALGLLFIGIPMLLFFLYLLFVPIGLAQALIQGHP